MIHAPEEWINQLKKILRFNLEGGQRVILFGSRATGVRLKEHSDFDLCVKGESKLDSHLLSCLKEGFVSSDLPVRVDTIDWFEAPPFLRSIIEKDGVDIAYQEKD